MKNIIQIVAIACLLSPLSLLAKDKWSSEGQVGCKVAISPNFSLSLRGGGNVGPFLDQVEHLERQPNYNDTVPTLDNPAPWERWGSEITFNASGFNRQFFALGFESALTTLGKIKITGGGDLLIQSRKMTLQHRNRMMEIDRTEPHTFFEVSPAGILSLLLPFSEGCEVSLVNRFERRMFRSPTNSTIPYGEIEPVGFPSGLRYTATVAINCPDLTPLRIAPLIYYEGMTQTSAKRHLVGWGYGFSWNPLKSFNMTFADRIRWDPNILGTTTHKLCVEAEYVLGVSGK